MEQLAYSLKYMRELTECPKEFGDRLFPMLFSASEYANMDVNKQMLLNRIMRTEIDRLAENEFARKQGIAQGREEGVQLGAEKTNRENALKMLALGATADFVRQVTGLSEEEVKSLMN